MTQSRLWTKDERRRTKDEGRRTKDDSSFVLVSEANGRPSSFVPRPSSFKNPRAVRRGLFILALAVAGFLVSDQLGLPPALIAIDAGLAALFFTGLDTNQILKELDYRDTFFFAGLFVLVGAAQASGLLNWFAQFIVHLSFGNVLVRCLLLMWVAAAATAFFNAGPCTALFLPLVLGFKTEAPQNLYWWSLSLGVLAGSSATLIGATAGSVTATMLSQAPVARRELRGRSWGQRPWPSAHQKQKGSEQKGSDPHQKKPSGGGLTPSALTPSALTFYSYARVAAPLALIFLTVSSVYVAWLYRYG
ncbi:MAG: hypothetical protein HY747_08225 [Elusimicrobia bacterium]|nr:hypothetical protein [Elusimicrobiota bacterium]